MTKTYNDALEWAAKWIEDTLRVGPETDERTIEFGTNMAMTLRAARVHPVDDARVQEIRNLTLPELCHLLGLLEARRESGDYAGSREQYYARTERLMKWCQEQING